MLYPDDHNIYIIIQGIMIQNKLFSNHEKFSSDLIYTGHIIQEIFQKGRSYNYCYEFTPLVNSYIISIPHQLNHLYRHHIQTYCNIHKSSQINLLSLWIHKNIRNRILHLFLLLCEITGRSYNKSLILDIKLSYKLIATITGSTRNTVSHIIKQLENDHIIQYTQKYIIIHNIFILNTYTSNRMI
uniref:Global nitrogen transcriptional regulator n=1 Tax=Titanophycus setchellii TaxID=940129 RepID=A0A1G4NYI5_9FLOR|nr:Global nitrogen transcriptional regulator [Titanophycus setchellii]SCW23684.1 Global nitrogen transcriptional regulator [Titanophycus setchellii]